MSEWTPERHETVEARCEGATPGPWRTGPINYADVYSPDGEVVALFVKDDGMRAVNDAQFTVGARTDLPDALEEIRASHAREAALAAHCESMPLQKAASALADAVLAYKDARDKGPDNKTFDAAFRKAAVAEDAYRALRDALAAKGSSHE